MATSNDATTLFLGFGSNLGARRRTIVQAIDRLSELEGMRFIDCSPLYESPALLPMDAPEEWDLPFINAVAMFECQLEPDALLKATQQVEMQAGKTYRGFWGPRELDVDLLSFGHYVQHGNGLRLPHPALASRDFVLLPWRDIAPNWMPFHDGQTIMQLCQGLSLITAQPLVQRAA